MIEIRLNLSFPDFSFLAELEIPSSGVTAIFGPSGSGKTTLLRSIAGLDRHKECFLSVGGEVWQDSSTFLPPHKRGIGYVFQEPELFPHLSVRKNLEYGSKRTPGERQRVSLEEAVELLGIGGLLERMPSALSGGERQRVAIARALAVSPRLLLMDEPLSSLDEALKREILPYLDRLHSSLDIPLIYVSHSADEVARLADKIALLDHGKVTAFGGIGEILTRLDLAPASGPEAESVIDATVSGSDEEFDLTRLTFPGGTFSVPGIGAGSGETVRLRVLARDVSLTLEEQQGTSILNIFPAVVEEIAPSGESQMTVRLDCGGTALLARVTRKSVSSLGLKKGSRVFAQAKSVAVLR